MALAESTSSESGLAVVVLALSLVTLSLLLLRWRRGRRAPLPDPPRTQLDRLRRQRDVQRSGEELIIQLEELARRISAQVDTKFAKLDQAIMDADDRLARLQAATARAERRAEQQSGGAAPSPGTPADETPAHVPSETEIPSDSLDSPDPRHQSVYDLADAGRAPDEIAERLALPLGEGEVILNLRSFR